MINKDKQAYIWAATYTNKPMLTEFEEDGTENSFYDIKENGGKLETFGLYGNGNSYLFNVNDGMLSINGKFVDMSYGDTVLTGETDYSDIITYKDAEAVLLPAGGVDNNILKFNIGYKAKVKNLSVRIIYTIDMLDKKPNYLTIRLVSPVDCDGILKIGNFKISAPLKANIGGEIKLFEKDFI